MCGIFATLDILALNPLSQANAYRGQHSNSISHFTVTDGVVSLNKINRRFGTIDLSESTDNGFYICHIQAPTGSERSSDTIHPADENGVLLWHNGIIKESECDRLREKQHSHYTWDTQLLLREVIYTYHNDDALSQINGSFACILYYMSSLYVFRNKLSPLFIGPQSISSVKCEVADASIDADKIYKIRFKNNSIELELISSFTTKENPYWGL